MCLHFPGDPLYILLNTRDHLATVMGTRTVNELFRFSLQRFLNMLETLREPSDCLLAVPVVLTPCVIRLQLKNSKLPHNTMFSFDIL